MTKSQSSLFGYETFHLKSPPQMNKRHPTFEWHPFRIQLGDSKVKCSSSLGGIRSRNSSHRRAIFFKNMFIESICNLGAISIRNRPVNNYCRSEIPWIIKITHHIVATTPQKPANSSVAPR
jgi:hypothetical protein